MHIILLMTSHTNRLRDLRLSKDLTQEQLADLSGTDQATISKLETDNLPNPLYRTVNNIARALGVSTDALMPADPLRHERRRLERRGGPRRVGEKRSGLQRRQTV